MSQEKNGLTRGHRLRVLKPFSKFKNTADNPIELDLDETSAEEQSTVKIKVNARNESSSKGASVEDSTHKTTIGSTSLSNKMEGKGESVRESASTKTTDEPKSESLQMEESKFGTPVKAPKYVIEIASTPRNTRSRKREELLNQQETTEERRAKIKEGKKIKDENRDEVSQKALIDRDVDKQPQQKKNTKHEESASGRRPKKMDTLRTRTSPRTLHETIRGLSTTQEKAVQEMGLGSLLKMSIDGVPSKIGFYVVDILNTKTMTLDTRYGRIPITVDSIHNLDLPKGGLNLLEMEDIPEATRITEEWKKQFHKTKMRPVDVMKLLYVEATISKKVEPLDERPALLLGMWDC
ncbi:hypothetical protein L6452_39002 [Arctium lappa]|uniref:Uncharacterized protein n=2 Tax=Arctium lappa TaxID=4217 RepID=A0ACB8XRC3_ARCLA|nr:hypothetical protein L6452_38999 [Arctium lappa]KAI3672901.1 hypothetical protein L6452_39002 [Arctium lappa]